MEAGEGMEKQVWEVVVGAEHLRCLDLIFQGSDVIRKIILLLCGMGADVAADAVTVTQGKKIWDKARVVQGDGEEEIDVSGM